MTRDRKSQISKADIVRQRRDQQLKNQVDRKVQRAQQMPAVQNTPIFVRRGIVGTPVVRRTQTQVKRRMVLPLQNGGEVSIPGLPIIRPGWRLVSAFIALVLTIFFSLAAFSGLFNVSSVSISGLQRNNSADVISVLQLENRPIYAIDPQEVLANMEQSFPEFYDAQVEVKFPTQIHIQVKERQPIIAWQYDNLTLWIDREGNIFSPRGSFEGLMTILATVSPPRLKVPMTEEEILQMELETGEEVDEIVVLKDGPVDPQFIQELLDLQVKMPEIQTLSFNEQDGFGWHDVSNDCNVYFGFRLNNLDQKLLLYESIKKYASDNGIALGLISVAHLRAPFYRLEQ